ncbi:integrase core domain-containing protein [Streptomyces sp. NPDC093064]|uniref:integrase core domain-containing protein n=1 Tax=Streptomyces sp. NPDC093064 TaxID=3366020 RepID=UPI0038084A88
MQGSHARARGRGESAAPSPLATWSGPKATPFTVEQVQTDNGQELGQTFHWRLLDKGIGHVRIKPRTPRLNGKVERSQRIDSVEFYRLREGQVIDDVNLFNSELQEWEDHYNYHHPTAPSPDRPPTNATTESPRPTVIGVRQLHTQGRAVAEQRERHRNAVCRPRRLKQARYATRRSRVRQAQIAVGVEPCRAGVGTDGTSFLRRRSSGGAYDQFAAEQQ